MKYFSFYASILSLANCQLHFASLGSWGTGTSAQYSVANVLKSTAKANKISFIVSPGSNFIDGVESLNSSEWKTHFENPYKGPELNLPFFTVLGQSDWSGNYTAQILRTNSTYDRGTEENFVVAPQWTIPNFWYHYTQHFTDSSEASTAYTATDSSVGFVFVDTYILSDSFPHTNITKLHWDATKNTIAAAVQIYDWVIVVGDKSIMSTASVKGDTYLSDTLRQLLKFYKVDAYISGSDNELGVIEDGSLVHITCGSGSGSSLFGRMNTDDFVVHMNRAGFCHHTLTQKKFTTEFVDGYTGSVMETYSKSRNVRERTLLKRFNVFQTLPEISFVEVPPWKPDSPMENDLFIRVCGSLGLIALTYMISLFIASFVNHLTKNDKKNLDREAY